MKNEDSLIERMRTIFVDWPIFNTRVGMLERLGYGLVALILTTVVSAWLILVIRK